MTNENYPVGSKRQLAGRILIALGSLLLIGSSVAKFVHIPKIVVQLSSMGFDGDKLLAIAILELVSAIFFLIRSTRSIGLLLISAYMGGAIATHVGHGSSPAQPGIVLTLLWMGAYLRHPQILWSLGPTLPSGAPVFEARQ